MILVVVFLVVQVAIPLSENAPVFPIFRKKKSVKKTKTKTKTEIAKKGK